MIPCANTIQALQDKASNDLERGFTPGAIEALYQRDIQRATDTFNALVEAAEKDRARRLAYAATIESKEGQSDA